MTTYEVTVTFSGFYTCYIRAKDLAAAEEKAQEMLDDGELVDDDREYTFQSIDHITEEPNE